MKVKNNRIHLYPIYSVEEDAYIKNDFDVKCSYDIEDEFIVFSSKPNITNETIIELFIEEKVKIYFHIECSKTKYRYAEEIKYDSTSKVKIENVFLNGKIIVSFWIVTQDDLKDISFKKLNEFYDNTSYNIPVYSYIGYSPSYEFYVEKDKKEDANYSSIFRISKHYEDTVNYDPTDSAIIIYLPDDAYKSYFHLKGTAIMTKISMIILPVLVDLINDIKAGESNYESFSWYPILNSKVEEMGYDDGIQSDSFTDEDSIIIAQMVFKDLVVKSLEEIEQVYLNGDDDE
jgi:hypothetical protein